MAEDKARDRVPSCDSARERNAGFRPQGPAVARMGFFNGLLYADRALRMTVSDGCAASNISIGRAPGNFHAQGGASGGFCLDI